MKERREQARYQDLLTRGFTDGYLHWEQQLNTRMRLQATPMTADDLWHYLWSQFNHHEAPVMPQCLVLREHQGDVTLTEEIRDAHHAMSVLIRGENGRPTHPKADREWVKVKGKFVGGIALESKPPGFVSAEHQLYFLWQVLAQFPDCECVCELAAADRMMARMTLQRLTRQSYTAMHPTVFKDVDVASQMRLTSRVGKAISQPSTIRTDAKLTVFALRNVGDNIEAAVLALSAQSMAFRKALEVTDALLATAGPAAANGLSSVFRGAFKRRGLSRCRCRLRM